MTEAHRWAKNSSEVAQVVRAEPDLTSFPAFLLLRLTRRLAFKVQSLS